jgi:hypothetical protein
MLPDGADLGTKSSRDTSRISLKPSVKLSLESDSLFYPRQDFFGARNPMSLSASHA